jgi:hypothetical protein
MDWDIEPTASSEYVTIQGGNTPELAFDSNDGLASANRSQVRATSATRVTSPTKGRRPRRALRLRLRPGGGRPEREFSIFYGAAANELDALTRSPRSMRVPTRWRSRAPRTVRRWDAEHLRLRIPHGPGRTPHRMPSTTRCHRASSAATVNVLANDSDPNNDPLTVTTFTQGAHGQVACEPTATAPTRRTQASSAATASSTRSRRKWRCGHRDRPRDGGVGADVDAGATRRRGGVFSRAGSFTDPDADRWSATVDYGDGGGGAAARWRRTRASSSHTYLDNGSYTVTVSVDDGHTSGSDSFQVTVSNVAPSVQAGLTPPRRRRTFRGRARSATRAVSTAGPPPSTTATAPRQPLLLASITASSSSHLHQRWPVHPHRHRQRRRRRRSNDTATITVEAAPTFALRSRRPGAGAGR